MSRRDRAPSRAWPRRWPVRRTRPRPRAARSRRALAARTRDARARRAPVRVWPPAASGIGRATATAFADEGAQVLAVDLDERGRELERNGGRVRFHRADVSDSTAVQGMVRTAADAFGGLDILFNNAGIFTYKPIHE